jgi:prephenate dehydratase
MKHISRTIAFQGVPGAYSEVAARSFLGPIARTVARDTFEDVFKAVQKEKVRYGVVPIENSLAGSIHENYDLLLSHRLHIIGETHLRIEHVLMAHPASSRRSIRFVRSHPQALAQCSNFFRKNRGIKSVPFFDTAGAALSLQDGSSPDTAAIAGRFAARLYGLKILKRNLEDRRENFTRFLLLSRTPARLPSHARTKCSIAFAPRKNQVGILFRILGVFALRDIDLLKIESRPDPRSAFQYLFYLDLAGDPRMPHVAGALEHLREMVTHFRLLGAYPRGSGHL